MAACHVRPEARSETSVITAVGGAAVIEPVKFRNRCRPGSKAMCDASA